MAKTTIFWSWAILTTMLQASIAKCTPSSGHVPDSHVKTLSGRQTSNPITSSFIRRGLHSSVIVGNHLFIDGGEVAQYIDGELDPRNARPNNLTLSIDLSSDWTNSTVQIKSIPKGDAPNFTYPGLWPNGDDGFFLWGGGVSGKAINTSTPEKGLWKFTADSTGNGTWEKVDPGDARVFNGLTRPSYGVWGASNDTGYYIGGTYSSASDPDIDSSAILPLTGMVTYNWETQTWKNVSSVPYTSPYGTVLSGKMQYVDTYGTQGLLVMLGGLQPGIDSWSEYSGQLPLTNLTIYDTATGEWYAQQTTGGVPGKRDLHCIVGVPGEDSYEIFLYGGYDGSQDIAYDDIWVLSLPGFHWFQISSETTGSPRSYHTCNRASSQMIVIGGVDYSSGDPADWQDPDPWDNGLGVFDLNDLGWKSSYNASAAAYETPQTVKDWYNNGGLNNVSWDSSGVKSLFQSATTKSAATDTSDSDEGSQSKSNVGAIAGGVVGGVVGLALLAGLAFFFLRRQRASGDSAAPVQVTAPVEKYSEFQYYELPDRQIEMGDSQDIVHELPDERVAQASRTK